MENHTARAEVMKLRNNGIIGLKKLLTKISFLLTTFQKFNPPLDHERNFSTRKNCLNSEMKYCKKYLPQPAFFKTHFQKVSKKRKSDKKKRFNRIETDDTKKR